MTMFLWKKIIVIMGDKVPRKEENNGKIESAKSLENNNNNIIQEKKDEINDINIQNYNIK